MLVTAYKINDGLVRNYEADPGNCSGVILICVTLVVTGGNLFWIVWQYITFTGCTSYNVIMSVTLIGVLAMHGLVLLRSRKDASVLTSGVASLYCLYLQWTALSSGTDTVCNPNLGERGLVIW